MGSELDIKQLDLELPNIIPKFINIKENCKWNSLRTNLHEYLNETYNGKYDSIAGLFTPSFDSQTVLELFFAKDTPLVEFGLL